MVRIKISFANEADAPAIVELLNEVDIFYGDVTAESPEERTTQIRRTLFSEHPSARVILARLDTDFVIGFASYSFLWPAAGSTKSLFLKELYVREGHRTKGIGRQLMQQLFDLALVENCSRVEWVTDRSNLMAQKFYETIGASRNDDKVFYRHPII